MEIFCGGDEVVPPVRRARRGAVKDAQSLAL
jgi:hypothetical protein